MDPRRLTSGSPARGGRLAEWLALGAAVIPTVVMVVRAAATGWVPLFDAAYFTIRSRDVATAHNPLVGAWSMGSREVGEWVNNLGPLQLDLLAPFTKLDPYWGTAAGVAAANIAAIVGVWLVSRRLFGAAGVVGAMAATVLIELDEGSLMLIEARQQLALVLPMWCLLWLAAALWSGRRWALPWLALAASFVLQTHFTYAYQTLFVAAAATAGLLVHHRRRVRELRRSLLVSSMVAVICWVQPLWDQFSGTGNLTAVLAQSGGSQRSVGASTGVRILAETAFVPPFFAPGSMGDLLRQGARPSLLTATVALTSWAVLLGVCALHRGAHRSLAAMASIGSVTLAGAVVATIKIPPTEQFGIIAQNYYWSWPMAVFMATTIVGSALRAPLVQLRREAGRTPFARGLVAAAVATALAAIPLLQPTDMLPETDHEWTVSREIARPLLDQLGESLDAAPLDGPVLVDLGAVRHVRYTLLAELQRRGTEFVFRPGATDLSRFGRDRCDAGAATYLLTLRGGAGALVLDGEETLLANVAGLSAEESDRSSELGALFGAAIRDGSVVIDTDGIAALGGEIPPLYAQVADTAGMPARRLSSFLGDWTRFEAVEVPDDLRDELAEWEALERRAAENRMAIYVRPIATDREDRCDVIEPGADFLAENS